MPENQTSEDRGQKSDLLEGSETTQLPWPRKGDSVFTPTREDWYNNACVNWLGHGIPALGLRASGYKEAAAVLVSHAIEQRHVLDFYIYPICFLYRHSLELTMKELIARGRRLTEGKYDYPKNQHDLLQLWEECRKLLLKLVDSVSQETLDAVGESMSQFNEVDPYSQTFRYTETQKGTPTLHKRITHINVRNLKEVMERVGNFLEGANEWLSRIIDFENDMREELRYLI